MKQGWKYKKLGEVCVSDLGKTLNSSKDKGELRPYLCAVNVLWDKIDLSTLKETRFEEDELERYSVKKGDLLVCEGGDVGRAAIWNDEAVIQYQNALHRIRFNGEVIPRFCLFYLRHLKDNGTLDGRYAKGVTIKHLVKSSLLSIPIPVPSTEEQKAICSLLDKLNRVIEAKKEQLKELDKLAQAIFYDMFGDPITNNKGWNVAKVIDVVKLQRGYDLPVQDRHSEGNIPIYGANGIVGYHTEAKAQYGIITGRSGSIGDVYMSKIPFWPLNTSLFSVDTHDNDIVFLMYLIRNYDLIRFKQGAGVPTLNRNSFHQNDIIDVPLHFQQAFAEKVEAIERQKELINQSIKDVQTLFDAKMGYYFGD